MHIRVKKWVKIVLLIILFIASFYFLSRYVGVKGLKVKEYSIVDSKLPSNFYGLKVIQLSDIHYNVTTDISDLKKIVNEINLLKPDIVILSGDLFDNNIKYNDKDINNITQVLNEIDYNIGKYAIKGENDTNTYWDLVIQNSNFIDLNDNYELIYSNGIEPILLVGISSNYKSNHINDTINEIYSKINKEYNFSMLVIHEPDFIDNIDYSKFNLIFAGHSHKGQIVLPIFNGIIKNKYSTKYINDYYELGNTKFFISSGIGTHKYKFRFLNKPSINLYRLRNK